MEMPRALAVLAETLSGGDLAALGLLLVLWAGAGWTIDHPPGGRHSVTTLMARVRRIWMIEVTRRDNRIADASIMGSLRQGTAFFASTSIFAVGGVLALIGNVAPLAGLAAEVGGESSALLWQVRLVPPALLLTHAFLKFVWAHRVFGYASVTMAAMPMAPGDPVSRRRAERAGDLLVQASLDFNRGLRSMYFALAALAWLAGPWALGLGAALVAGSLLRREFGSVPHDVLDEAP